MLSPQHTAQCDVDLCSCHFKCHQLLRLPHGDTSPSLCSLVPLFPVPLPQRVELAISKVICLPCRWTPSPGCWGALFLSFSLPSLSGSPAECFHTVCPVSSSRSFTQVLAGAQFPPRPLLAPGLFFPQGVLAFVLTLCFWPFGSIRLHFYFGLFEPFFCNFMSGCTKVQIH